jgi:hypothetical protein
LNSLFEKDRKRIGERGGTEQHDTRHYELMTWCCCATRDGWMHDTHELEHGWMSFHILDRTKGGRHKHINSCARKTCILPIEYQFKYLIAHSSFIFTSKVFPYLSRFRFCPSQRHPLSSLSETYYANKYLAAWLT